MGKSDKFDSSKEVTRSDAAQEFALCAFSACGVSKEDRARSDGWEKEGRRPFRDDSDRSKTQKLNTRKVDSTLSARRKALRGFADEELLSGLERLHGEERAVLLDIVLSFSEVERRRLYVPMGYGSLFEFCMDRYRYSRATAFRRISAARCIERYPRVAELFLAGELSLSSISMIAGILTKEHAAEILARARGRSIKDIEMLVARHRPAGVIRDRIKPVFVMNPDAGSGGDGGSVIGTGGGGIEPVLLPGATAGGANVLSRGNNANTSLNIETERKIDRASAPGEGRDTPSAGTDTPDAGNDARAEYERVTVTRKFKIEFAVEPGFIAKLHKIKALMSSKFPNGIGLEQVIDMLMDEYLYRHGPERRMKKRESRRGSENKGGVGKRSAARDTTPEKGYGTDRNRCAGEKDRGGGFGSRGVTKKQKDTRSTPSRTRHIPQTVRDEVFVRDGGRCTYVGPDGRRCGETWNLEIDHIIPYAKGGSNAPENLRLLCPAHNRLAAEREFGGEHMEKYYKRE
jgi:hypothetical protein